MSVDQRECVKQDWTLNAIKPCSRADCQARVCASRALSATKASSAQKNIIAAAHTSSRSDIWWSAVQQRQCSTGIRAVCNKKRRIQNFLMMFVRIRISFVRLCRVHRRRVSHLIITTAPSWVLAPARPSQQSRPFPPERLASALRYVSRAFYSWPAIFFLIIKAYPNPNPTKSIHQGSWSPHRQIAHYIAHSVAKAYPEKYETWYYFASSTDFHAFTAKKFEPVPFPGTVQDSDFSTFVRVFASN